MHRHQDVEIFTYVRRGAVTHEDSLGNRGTVRAGDVQAMSACRATPAPAWPRCRRWPARA
jgi:redox-sensitive bicupin YhaK (pirin superfamily)